MICGEPLSVMVAVMAPANIGRRRRNSLPSSSWPITSLAIAPPSSPAARPTMSLAQVVDVATTSSALWLRATSAITCAQRSATELASAALSAASTGANFEASAVMAAIPSPSTSAVTSSVIARAKPRAAPLPDRNATPSCSIKTSVFIIQSPPLRAAWQEDRRHC